MEELFQAIILLHSFCVGMFAKREDNKGLAGVTISAFLFLIFYAICKSKGLI
jgi:hypothetical protein